jgi:hypothetical protein
MLLSLIVGTEYFHTKVHTDFVEFGHQIQKMKFGDTGQTDRQTQTDLQLEIFLVFLRARKIGQNQQGNGNKIGCAFEKLLVMEFLPGVKGPRCDDDR